MGVPTAVPSIVWNLVGNFLQRCSLVVCFGHGTVDRVVLFFLLKVSVRVRSTKISSKRNFRKVGVLTRSAARIHNECTAV